MAISAVVAGLITISLAATISEFQSKNYEANDLPYRINSLKQEVRKITDYGEITDREKTNFRRMINSIETYQVDATFNSTEECVKLTIEDPKQRAELPCIN
jgi:hypothetical protein